MTRLHLLSSIASSIIATTSAATSDTRYRELWLVRDDEEVRVPFTRDGSFVYLAGFRSISWILRDKRAPVAQGYASISIDLIETLFDIQGLVGGGPLDVGAGFCTHSDPSELETHSEQHREGLAVDLHLSPAKIASVRAQGYVTHESVYASHVHVAALADRWRQSRVPT